MISLTPIHGAVGESAPRRIYIAGARGKQAAFVRGEPTPQVITPDQRRAAKAKRKAARAARKQQRK